MQTNRGVAPSDCRCAQAWARFTPFQRFAKVKLCLSIKAFSAFANLCAAARRRPDCAAAGRLAKGPPNQCRRSTGAPRKAIQLYLHPQIHRQARHEGRAPGSRRSRSHQTRRAHTVHTRRLSDGSRAPSENPLLKIRRRQQAARQPRRQRSRQEYRHDRLSDPTGRSHRRDVQEAG